MPVATLGSAAVRLVNIFFHNHIVLASSQGETNLWNQPKLGAFLGAAQVIKPLIIHNSVLSKCFDWPAVWFILAKSIDPITQMYRGLTLELKSCETGECVLLGHQPHQSCLQPLGSEEAAPDGGQLWAGQT